jgi:hypothetical protein
VKPRLTAAAGLALAVAALTGISLFFGPTGQAGIAHTCYPVDRQFIVAAQLNMASLSAISEDYLHGNAKPADVIEQTNDALKGLRHTRPADPSLTRTKLVLKVMFVEYQKAIVAEAHHHGPGTHIYRAYGLANLAHDLLAQAEKPLKQRGCDVGRLL